MPFKFNPFTDKLDLVVESLSPTGDVSFLTGNSGGPIPPDGSGNINIIGAGALRFDGNAGTNTLTGSIVGGGLQWNTIAGTSQSMAVNNGYIPLNVGLTTITLPATAAVGDIVAIGGFGAGGWTLAQNSGQTVHLGNQATTIGVGGSISSTNQYDAIYLLCVVANTTFLALNAVGNLTVV